MGRLATLRADLVRLSGRAAPHGAHSVDGTLKACSYRFSTARTQGGKTIGEHFAVDSRSGRLEDRHAHVHHCPGNGLRFPAGLRADSRCAITRYDCRLHRRRATPAIFLPAADRRVSQRHGGFIDSSKHLNSHAVIWGRPGGCWSVCVDKFTATPLCAEEPIISAAAAEAMVMLDYDYDAEAVYSILKVFCGNNNRVRFPPIAWARRYWRCRHLRQQARVVIRHRPAQRCRPKATRAKPRPKPPQRRHQQRRRARRYERRRAPHRRQPNFSQRGSCPGGPTAMTRPSGTNRVTKHSRCAVRTSELSESRHSHRLEPLAGRALYRSAPVGERKL